MPEPQPVTLAAHAMGTRFEFVLHGGDEPALLAAGEAAIELIEDAHRRLSRFERGSVVYELNASAGVRAVAVDDELFDLLDRCERYRGDSCGAFSILLSSPVTDRGGAVRREAEGEPPETGGVEQPEDPLRPADGGPPPPSVTGEVKPKPPLRLDAALRTVSITTPRTSLDLGGVAKGFAIDLAAGALRDAGVSAALVHGGASTIAAFGARPDGGPWSVALPNPDDTPGPRARLADLAISTSSQHGDRPGHIVDPRTGRPARACPFAACLGPSAEETDAWATALTVLGERPATMPPHLTSVIRSGAGNAGPASPTDWVIEGPHRDSIVF